MAIMFFQWLAGVIGNPDDDQGSTGRLCLVMLIAAISCSLVGLVVYEGKFPEVPGSLAAFLLSIIVTLTGKTVADRYIEGKKEGSNGNPGDSQ